MSTTNWGSRHLAEWKVYPFVVFFSEERPNTGKDPAQFTGTLIHDYYILTAAHNVFNMSREQSVDVSNLTIMFSNRERRSGAADIYPSFHCCQDYRATGDLEPLAFDAALIKLSKPAPVSVTRIDLSLDDDSAFPDSKTYAEVLGWDLSGPDRLWRLPARFTRFSQKGIHEDGKFQTNAKTESGDSGGPLVVKQDDGSWIQIGIHSGYDEKRISRILRRSHFKFTYSTRIAHPTISSWIQQKVSPL